MTTPQIPPEASLIEYPCDFPIKVMGLHDEAYIDQIVALVVAHAPEFDAGRHLVRRPSSSGKYIGLTLTVRATSREQLDTIYRAVTGHPQTKYVL